MDASISSDPWAPDEVTVPDFRGDRWRRAGASDDEVAALAAAAAAMTPLDQIAEARAIDATSDGALAVALENMRASGDFGGFRATPVPDADADAEDTLDGSESAEGGASGDPESDASRGPWEPAEEPLDVDGESYPAWNLAGGWVGTELGSEAGAVRLVAADRDALAAKVTALLAAQEPPAKK